MNEDLKNYKNTVSPSCSTSPQMFPIIMVLHFPPRESLRKCVSLHCLYGICFRFLSCREIMVCSKKVSDLLMYVASCLVVSTDCVFPNRSEPARSTRLNLERKYLVCDWVLLWDSTCNVKIQCDLEEEKLSLCWLMIRLDSP